MNALVMVLRTSILSIQELYTGTKRIVSILMDGITEDTHMSSIIAAINPLFEEVEDALARQRGSSFTELIQSKDANRDARFMLLRNFVYGWTKVEEEKEKRAAAKLLYRIMTDVGLTLYKLGYARETAQLNALINRLGEADAQQAIVTLEALEMYTALKASQVAFEELYESKVAQEASKEYPLIVELKSSLSQYVKLLLMNVNFLAEQDKEAYATVVEELNMIISELNANAQARLTREENEENGNSVEENSENTDE